MPFPDAAQVDTHGLILLREGAAFIGGGHGAAGADRWRQ